MSDWDDRYRRGEHATLKPHRLLERVADMIKPGVALDLACGAGRHAVFLAQSGWQVIAVDSSTVAIETARSRAGACNVTIDARIADLEEGGFVIEPGAFDLICDFYYLQRDLFPHIRAGVKPGGVFVAAIHLRSENPSDDEGHNPAFLLNPGELRAEFANWEIIHYGETSAIDADARHHHRRSAEIIAKKR
jgi:tellurite methyltransferase